MDNGIIEIFGRYTNLACPAGNPWDGLRAETAGTPFKSVICPYKAQLTELYKHTDTGIYCDKIRKAQPNPLIGNCIVRKFNGKKTSSADWLVCPSRFVQDKVIFDDCKKFLVSGDEYSILKEIKINDGSLDYVLASIDKTGIADFVAMEIQACGTGGSGPLWDCRNDYLTNSLKTDYSFTLNEKDASKKILVQLLHKARQVARWRKNTVLVIQDVFLEHLRKAYNIDAHFHKQDEQDFIHIHSYEVVLENNAFSLRQKEALSTDMVGLSMALISNPASGYSKLSTTLSTLKKRIVDNKSTEL